MITNDTNISHEKREKEKKELVYIWVSDQCSQPVNSPSTPGCQQSVYSRMLTVRLLQDVNSPPTPGCQQSVYSRMSTVRLLQDVNSPSTPGC